MIVFFDRARKVGLMTEEEEEEEEEEEREEEEEKEYLRTHTRQAQNSILSARTCPPIDSRPQYISPLLLYQEHYISIKRVQNLLRSKSKKRSNSLERKPIFSGKGRSASTTQASH